MTRKSRIHSLWQCTCHYHSQVCSSALIGTPKVRNRIVVTHYSTASFQTPQHRNRPVHETARVALVSAFQNKSVLTPSHSVTTLAISQRWFSCQPRLEKAVAKLHHIPRYDRLSSTPVRDGSRHHQPPPNGDSSPSVQNDEAPVKSNEPIALKEPLTENGVLPSNPEEISRLYDELLRHAASGHVGSVVKLITAIVRKHREKPNLRLYRALILVNISPSSGSAAAVASILEEMEAEGIPPDINIYHDALKALAVHPDCLLRGSILAEMRRKWFTLTESGWHDVVAGYTRELLIEQALDNLEAMRKLGIRVQGWLHDMLLYILCDLEEIEEALHLMKSIVAAGDNTVSSGSWYYLFDYACAELHYDTLRFVWRRRVEQQYLNPTSGQCLQVLTAAARQGDVQIATDVFRILSKRATTFESQHYELLIESYINANDLRTALTILCIMNGAGLTPTQSATCSILKYLTREPERPQEAFQMLNEMTGDRQVPTEAMNRIIEACIHQNGLEQAIEMYSSLHRVCSSGPNVATFNTLLVGCRNANRKDTAMFLANEMIALKIKPNTLTYDRLVLICLREQEYEDALRYYNEMLSAGLTPREGTMVEMIKRCCNAKDERAGKLLEDMKRFGMDDTVSRRHFAERFPEHRWHLPEDRGIARTSNNA